MRAISHACDVACVKTAEDVVVSVKMVETGCKLMVCPREAPAGAAGAFIRFSRRFRVA